MTERERGWSERNGTEREGRMASSSKAVRSALRSARVAFFVSIWFTMLTLVAVWYLTTAVLLVLAPAAGAVSLALLLATLLVPLETRVPRAVEWLLERSVAAFIEYLPVEVTLHESWTRLDEEEKETREGKREEGPGERTNANGTTNEGTDTKTEKKMKMKKKMMNKGPPYIIAYEPHGVLPLIMCIFAGSVAKPATLGLPPQLDHAAILASDAVFWVPILRNLWYWLVGIGTSTAVRPDPLTRATRFVRSPGTPERVPRVNRSPARRGEDEHRLVPGRYHGVRVCCRRRRRCCCRCCRCCRCFGTLVPTPSHRSSDKTKPNQPAGVLSCSRSLLTRPTRPLHAARAASPTR